jgi:uncharacterized membrane protein
MSDSSNLAFSSSQLLIRFFDTVFLIALSSWIGAVTFFSFVVAPLIFRTLSPDQAARFVRMIFPRYYAWVALCASVALPSIVCAALLVPALRGPQIGIMCGFALISALLMLYCGNVLTPLINQARDQGAESRPRFEKLHKRSVVINLVVLLSGLALAFLFALRATPPPELLATPSQTEMIERNLELYERNMSRFRRTDRPELKASPRTQSDPLSSEAASEK